MTNCSSSQSERVISRSTLIADLLGAGLLVDHYVEPQRLTLTQQQKSDLVEYLKRL